MANKDIKIKNVSVVFPKIKIGGKSDRHKKGSEKPVPKTKQS